MNFHSIFRTRNINVAIFAMAVSLLPVIQSPLAFAAEKSFDCAGGGKYKVVDGAVRTDYDNECSGDVVLDDSVTTLNYVEFFSKVTSVTIPATVVTIESQPFVSPELVSIEVASSNENFTSIDGVLYSKDRQTLILYPANKADESFMVPNGVTTIKDFAFGCLNNLKNLTLPESVIAVGEIGFINGCNQNSLESYNVSNENEEFSSIDGVLFDKSATLQISYPKSKHGSNYEMVDSVKQLKSTSFGLNLNLRTITLSKNLETIGRYSFKGPKIDVLNIPASVKRIDALGLDSVKSISVDPLNPNFATKDGNLFNHDLTQLIAFFDNVSQTSYTLPNSVSSIANWVFGNGRAPSLNSLTINSPIVESGSIGAQIKYLNLGKDFKISNHFNPGWKLNKLIKVNYCGDDAKTLEDINSQLATNWNNASLVCIPTLPVFELSSPSEGIEDGLPIKGFTVAKKDFVEQLSISPDPTKLGLTFDAGTGLLSGTLSAGATLPVEFSIISTNMLGMSVTKYLLTEKVVEPTPTPEPIVPISEVIEPTPVVISPPAKSTYFAVTTSTKNLSKVIVTKAATIAKVKLGKSLLFMIASIGNKDVLVKVSVKDPSGKSFEVASKLIAKNKSYSSPIMKFSKVGKYTITTFVGSAKKVITVTVSK
jgi:hypothetical protein